MTTCLAVAWHESMFSSRIAYYTKTILWNVPDVEHSKSCVLSKITIISNLPSRLMPADIHFLSRQYWQRLRLIRRILHCWFLVHGRYWIFCWIDLRKNPWKKTQEQFLLIKPRHSVFHVEMPSAWKRKCPSGEKRKQDRPQYKLQTLGEEQGASAAWCMASAGQFQAR